LKPDYEHNKPKNRLIEKGDEVIENHRDQLEKNHFRAPPYLVASKVYGL
jgi:hypothetical protein